MITNKEQSNRSAKDTWEKRPVGSQRSEAKPGDKKYFEDIRNYRYGYETPFIQRLFRFDRFANCKVLEIGVGNGIDAVEIAKHGGHYTGIDITEKHLELTKKNFTLELGREPQLVFGDLTRVQITDTFDYVYSFGVLHHISHEDEYLKVIHGLLKSDGRLLMAVYSKYSFFNIYMLITWILKNRMRSSLWEWKSHLAEMSELNNPVTIKIRSKSEVQKMLEASGFQVVDYHKRGFVQKYIPLAGGLFKPDGITLNFLGSLLGWYHLLECRKK